jgi:hypothetical protein
MAEGEINCLEIIVIKGRENVGWRSEVLGENKKCVIEFNGCDTADGFKGENR